MKLKQKVFFFSLVVFSFIFLTLPFSELLATKDDSASGWAWSGTSGSGGGIVGFGWLSMNNINCDLDDNGQSDGGYGCPPAGTSISKYGVDVPSVGNELKGYAWSDKVGWVSFNSSDLSGCPSGTCNARRVDGGSGNPDEIHGWARILSITGSNNGGFDGWIKLHSESGDSISYGVTLDDSVVPMQMNGYAWSSEFGWIDFSRVIVEPDKGLVICPSSFTMSQGSQLQLKLYYGGVWNSVSCSYVQANSGDFVEVTSDANTNWQSGDSTIATVDNSTAKGLVSANIGSNGTTVITATYDGLVANSYVTVQGGNTGCGNGVIDSGEDCDDGSSGNGVCPLTCSPSCKKNKCLCTN